MLHFPLLLLSFSLSCLAYQVTVRDTDYSRQTCSGMWASESTYINITFNPDAQGQLAMSVLRPVSKPTTVLTLYRLVYEWTDVQYLGKVTSYTDEQLPVCSLTRMRVTLIFLSRRRMCALRTRWLVASALRQKWGNLSSTFQATNP
jgi:hypothetical protein